MNNFGLTIGIEDKNQFKNALADINRAFRVHSNDMVLVTSQFDKNDKSINALTSRNTVLNKEITAQKDKIAILKYAFQKIIYHEK